MHTIYSVVYNITSKQFSCKNFYHFVQNENFLTMKISRITVCCLFVHARSRLQTCIYCKHVFISVTCSNPLYVLQIKDPSVSADNGSLTEIRIEQYSCVLFWISNYKPNTVTYLENGELYIMAIGNITGKK